MRFLVLIFAFCIGGLNAQVTILNTDFQSGIPTSYSLLDIDGLVPDPSVSEYTNAWIVLPDPENPSDTVASSTSFFSPVGTANRWLITPQLTLGSYGNLLEWEAKSQDASYPDDYLVLVSTTDMDISSFTDTIGYIIGEDATWTTRQVDLSEELYNDSIIYIAFVNVTEDGFKLYLDDIKVIKDDPSMVHELDNNAIISVYPNPTSDIINIESDEKFNYIKLSNLNGQIITSTENNQINLQDYPKGIYFLDIVYSWGTITKKVLKF
jgi:hypothetical protein